MDPNSNKARKPRRKKLGQFFLDEGLIKEEELLEVLALQKTRPEQLGHLLREKKLVSYVQVARALARQHNIPFLRLGGIKIHPNVLNLIPAKLARANKLIPVKKTADGLIVAVSNPELYFKVEQDLRFVAQMSLRAVVVAENELNEALKTFYPERQFSSKTDDSLPVFKDIQIVRGEDPEEKHIEDIEKLAGQAPVVRFANSVFAEAITMGASDIHIEPGQDQVMVRFRIDGIMRPIMRIDRKNLLPVVSRLKIISDLDISIRRKPQDGKTQIKYGGQVYDLRVSILPTYYGEKTTIRILNPASTRVTPEELGLVRKDLDHLLEALTRPDGIIVVTGPTGSGKTSTLYACLNRLNTPEVNIVTVEDPVEFDVAGINQVQISPRSGVDFAAALRSILRQDPDIVMVGEIRDQETAEISMQAAQTGHLVLSTLHTNDSPSALIRLMDLGVEPFLISSSLIMAIGQRLVRRICPMCKTPADPSPWIMKRIARSLGEREPVFWKGAGCEECNQTGYKGRLGIFELLVMTTELKKMITRDISPEQLKEIAGNQGYRTMFVDGLEKALDGLTTLEEVFRTSTPENLDQAPQPDPTDAAPPDQPATGSAVATAAAPPAGTVQTGPSGKHIADHTPAFLDQEPVVAAAKQTTVLVVDDSPDILLVLKRSLEAEHLSVVTAEDGARGLEAAMARTPDLIITDYKMPVMDGLALVRELKKQDDLKNVPVIMLTAKGEVESEVMALEAGADDYLVKPVDRRRFIARIRRYLDR